ncbi:hypothetical protein EB796_014186 [Bugula neritina]|uniref:FCH domain-containing protein n=1 Tax=Bugula neritina TaxID=10212 RepID=A0A7J7JMH9_BUGNE|nr:hypothetical protein EB796_014186 [Bugula neritina]
MATFEKCMMGSSAQDHVLRLQDTEIKLLEMVRDCIQARVQSDKEYARLLSQSCVKAHKHEHLIKTPFSQVRLVAATLVHFH